MRSEDPTDLEVVYFDAVRARIPDAQDWYHRDPDGSLWMTVSVDTTNGRQIVETWRCDYDGKRLLGGRSPACLNWDDGVRALDAGIDVTGPDGLHRVEEDPVRAAEVTARWFADRLSTP